MCARVHNYTDCKCMVEVQVRLYDGQCLIYYVARYPNPLVGHTS